MQDVLTSCISNHFFYKHNMRPRYKEENHFLFLPHLGRMIILIAFLNGVRETTSLPVTGRHEMP